MYILCSIHSYLAGLLDHDYRLLLWNNTALLTTFMTMYMLQLCNYIGQPSIHFFLISMHLFIANWFSKKMTAHWVSMLSE
jgi:hypothetical protein